MKYFMPKVRRFKFGEVFGIPFFSKVRVECWLGGNIFDDNALKVREIFINLSRGGRQPLVRSSRAIDEVNYAIGSSKSSQYCTRFKEVADDVMEGAQRRVGFLLGDCNKISKFRILSLFFEGRKTKRKIDMAVGVKLLEFGDSYKGFRS